MNELNEHVARRVLEVVDAGLVRGLGTPVPGALGVESAVCYALGLPHGDDPACVSTAVRRLAGRLNDARWTSPLARARGLRRLAVAQLGTAGTLDEREFAHRVARLAIQTCVPTALRAAAQRCSGAQRERLLSAATVCEREPSHKNALTAHAATTHAAADDVAFFATGDAVYAAYAAAYASTGDAAYYAAAAAYNAAAAAAACADYADAATHADQRLGDFAERVVRVLRDLGSPGSAFLYLTE